MRPAGIASSRGRLVALAASTAQVTALSQPRRSRPTALHAAGRICLRSQIRLSLLFRLGLIAGTAHDRGVPSGSGYFYGIHAIGFGWGGAYG